MSTMATPKLHRIPKEIRNPMPIKMAMVYLLVMLQHGHSGLSNFCKRVSLPLPSVPNPPRPCCGRSSRASSITSSPWPSSSSLRNPFSSSRFFKGLQRGRTVGGGRENGGGEEPEGVWEEPREGRRSEISALKSLFKPKTNDSYVFKSHHFIMTPAYKMWRN